MTYLYARMKMRPSMAAIGEADCRHGHAGVSRMVSGGEELEKKIKSGSRTVQ